MNREQWHLFTRRCGGWQGLWLLTDYDSARSHIVSGQGGGTYYFADGSSGWYDTDAKGLHARIGTRGDDLVAVTWPMIREWVNSASRAAIDKAAELRDEGHRIQRTWVSWKASARAQGCGRPPAVGPVTRERALYEAEYEAWHINHAAPFYAAKSAHEAEVKAFLETLAPNTEPTDLLELLAQLGATV